MSGVSATQSRYLRYRWSAVGELVAILSDGRSRTAHELQAEWRRRHGVAYTVESIHNAVCWARAKGHPIESRRHRRLTSSGDLVGYALRRPEPVGDDWGLL